MKVKHFHWSHVFAVLILGGYFLLSKVNTLYAISNNNLTHSFLQLYVFGAFFACSLLFIVSHNKFFSIAGEIEKSERKTEDKYLKKYSYHNKVLTTFLIGTIGGPIFSSVTARLLLNNYSLKYLIVLLANIASTTITFAIARGFIKLINVSVW